MPETATEIFIGKRWVEQYTSIPIILYPNPALRQPGQQVESFDDDLAQLAGCMAAAMYSASGVGLAAAQVAHTKRLILVDPWRDDRDPVFAVNPKILSFDGYIKGEEGCLSIPGFAADVERAFEITVAYQDLHGQHHEETYTDFPAVVFQHEIDHLDGILFPDRIGRLKRQAFIKEFGLERRKFRKPVSMAAKA